MAADRRQMKRIGIEPLETNGREPFGVPAKLGEPHVGNGESEIARKIEQSISYMLRHLHQPLQVATLASVVNFSPSHYSALFKRLTGCPPIDYFIHLRMQHACWLFDNTSMNVKEVAAALGYDDPFYFSRTFKKVVNQVAPSEYRLMPETSKNTIKMRSWLLPFPALKGVGQFEDRMNKRQGTIASERGQNTQCFDFERAGGGGCERNNDKAKINKR
jgi:AraC-like DNA-binding protein